MRTIVLPTVIALCAAAPVSLAQGSVDLESRVYLRGLEITDLERSLGDESPVGREQAGNRFRDRTPLLETAERAEARVDLVALRERKLRMYAEGAVFHAPAYDPATPHVEAAEPDAKSRDAGGSSSSLTVVLSVFLWLIVGIFAVVAMRSPKRGRAPD